MAKLIKFMSESDETLLTLRNRQADIVKSHTIIYNPKSFSVLRLIESVSSIDIDPNRARINYKSGRYLLIKS